MSLDMNQIRSLCDELTSNKVTERRKASDKFLQIVRTAEALKNLNNNGEENWKLVIDSVHKYLVKESEKAFEDKKKRGTSSQLNGVLFNEIVKLTISEGKGYQVGIIIKCISQALEYEILSLYCLTHYLNALQNIMLPNEYIRSHMEVSDWDVIYSRLKKRFKTDLQSGGIISKDILSSLSQYIKYGPLHGLSTGLLREQFCFIHQICENVNMNSTRPIQVAVVEILYYFCLHTAKDSRSSCCKLGEDTFHALIGLYEIQNPRNDGMKMMLIQYLLLQFILHHPTGVFQNNSAAFAHSWEKWNQCIKSIYRKCKEDISHCSKFYSHRGNTIPICVENEIKYLHKDFARLFAESMKQVEFNLRLSEKESFQESSKRIKIESPILDLINSIETSQQWPWINVMCTLLRAHPDVLTESYFISLLQILSKLQVECKDNTLAHHIYCCLGLLEGIQHSLQMSDNPEIQNIWGIIRDTALRTFGLNQNDTELHHLLQRLITGAYNIKSENILQTYSSEVLDVTENNLKTLATVFDRLSVIQTTTQNELLIKWILSKNNLDDYSYLSRNITARILVGLIVNKWPIVDHEREFTERETGDEPYQEIINTYMKLGFETSLIPQETENNLKTDEFKRRKVVMQDDLCMYLKNSLTALIDSLEGSNNNTKNVIHFLNIITLIKNILNFLINLELLDVDAIAQSILLEIITTQLNNVTIILNNCYHNEDFDEVTISVLNESTVCFGEFLAKTSSSHLDETIREIIGTDFLGTFFSFLLKHGREHKADFKELRMPLLNLRKNVIKTLVLFSCGVEKFTTSNQNFMFDALVEFKYTIDECSNCDLPFIFLESIIKSKFQQMDSKRISALLSLLYNLCTTRYRYYSCAKNILEFIYEFSSNVANNGSNNSKEDLMNMLFPFFLERKNYGPEYSVILVNCIGKLYQLDINHEFAKWNGNEVILKLPEFLCSEYVEVRFGAIQNIVKFFETSSSRKKIQDFHLQEMIFQNIFDKCDKIFEVEGNITKERQVDEIVSRSASALHVLGSILMTSHQWRENALFALFQIIHKRRLDSFPKVLKMIAQHLNLADESVFLEKHSNAILRRWLNEGMSLDGFLFSLFGCEDASNFYEKYLNVIVPYLIENKKGLEALECTGKSVRSILEECFSTLCVSCLVANIEKVTEFQFERNSLIKFVVQHFGHDDFNSYFIEKIDEISLTLISVLRDEEDFRDKLNVSLILPKSSIQTITVGEFHKAIDVIKVNVCPGQPLMLFLLLENVNKLLKMMMKLNIKIHTSIALEDKLLGFHHYTIINDLFIDHLGLSTAKEYFIKDLCYTIIRIIKKNSEYLELRRAAIIYFRKCLPQLMRFPEIIKKYFTPAVSTFINIIIEEKDESLLTLSLDLLKYLIYDHKDIFDGIIEYMDNLPDHHLLVELSQVQSESRSVGGEMSLNREIKIFVDNGPTNKDCPSKIETLKNLKMYLFTQKKQLRNLYKNLIKLNRFSEDCENSLLHQLVSLLVDLCHSKDKNVSMEALKCLGELGPSDLTTLIVKPEKHLSFENSTPQEFFTGQVISLLYMYITDDNVELICPSIEVLFDALNTAEGRKAIELRNDYGYGVTPSEYFIPFFIEKRPKSFNSSLKNSMGQLISRIDSDQLWCPKESVIYDNWIRNLLCNLLQTISNCYLPFLIPICKLKVEFCEVLLPSLVYLLVSLNDNVTSIITEKINKFFQEHWSAMIQSSKQNLIVLNEKAVKVMLSVVHFVRVNKKNIKLKKKIEDLNLDYLKIAKAAQYCSAYFTSLLYTEIWCQSRVESVKSIPFNSSILDFIHESEEEEISLAVLNILRSSFKAIGDDDSLQGCGTSLLSNPHLRIEHFKDVGMWDQAILYQNMQISQGIQNSKEMLIDSVKHCGLYETALMCTDPMIAPDYECMWRLSDWTLPDIKKCVEKKQISFQDEMEKYKYLVLKGVHERDVFSVMENIEEARLLVVEKLKHTSLESSSNLYGILVYLQSFNEIEEFLNASSNTDDLNLVMKKWYHQDEIEKKFMYVEPIMTQRMVILNDFMRGTEEVTFYKDHLFDLSLKLSEKSRFENINHFGIRALNFIRNLPNLTQNEQNRILLEDAQQCWKSNNKLIGRRILNKISGNENIDIKLRSEAFKLIGKWSTESYSEHAKAIIEDYLEESLILIKDAEKTKHDMKSIYDTYDTLGRFADREYQQVTAHIASDVFQKKMENLQKANETIQNLKKAVTVEERIAKAFHERQSAIDAHEIENTKKEKDYFLKVALKYYMKNLSCSDESLLQVYRVVALFLENRTASSTKEIVEKYIDQIPTYKFLTILPQLIPHIAYKNTEDFFSLNANKIIDKCAREHPHHTLPIILSLANSLKDAEYSKVKTKIIINEERVSEAKRIIKGLKNHSLLKNIINGLEAVSDALVELAYLEPKENRKKIDIPRTSKIAAIKNLTSVPVLTQNLLIKKNGKYDDIVGIHSYNSRYSLVGGKNLPKKITCFGTDGKQYEQLVKGQDDLRQDAVMQQVFVIMNSLLMANKQSCGLKIRTYKIVPLSMRSGVLEWAVNTMPVGAYLTGDAETEGAHQRYRPHDKRPSTCRQEIADAAKTSADNRLRVFNKVCKEFKPVFHKFFEENFLHPTVWYERRLAFIHSAATTSMVGYILGLGDRHVSNILIDKTTAELVHIDFGIAFEQGRTLPTPETVPFRLTRDFVDGMGVSGVEGAFKKSCEKTMTVMKDNYQTIMAILEVLLYDPLYSWTVSVAEANKRQRGSLDESTYRTSPQCCEGDISVNTTAQRALMRLKAKLLGTEEGTPMSVEHQVAALIHQAMDPANLSKLYCGWQAYL